jgi:hypothetical protein
MIITVAALRIVLAHGSLLAACFTLHSINATLAIVPQRGAGLWICKYLLKNCKLLYPRVEVLMAVMKNCKLLYPRVEVLMEVMKNCKLLYLRVEFLMEMAV